MTTSSESATEATQDNSTAANSKRASAPAANSKRASAPAANSKRASGWDQVVKTARTAAKEYFQHADIPADIQQIYDLRYKARELKLKKEQAEANEARLRTQMKDDKDKFEAKLKDDKDRFKVQAEADRAKWEAKVLAETWADKIRSIVLVCVVLAVVATPIFAMWRHVTPRAFVQFVAPITAIAGTVLGYWFGQQDRSLKMRRANPKG